MARAWLNPDRIKLNRKRKRRNRDRKAVEEPRFEDEDCIYDLWLEEGPLGWSWIPQKADDLVRGFTARGWELDRRNDSERTESLYLTFRSGYRRLSLRLSNHPGPGLYRRTRNPQKIDYYTQPIDNPQGNPLYWERVAGPDFVPGEMVRYFLRDRA